MDALPRVPLGRLIRMRADGDDTCDGWSIDRVIAANTPAPHRDPSELVSSEQCAADADDRRYRDAHPLPPTDEMLEAAREQMRAFMGEGADEDCSCGLGLVLAAIDAQVKP